jgi:hypothetical protein
MSKIEIHKFNESHSQEWDAFIDKSNNGTMFHKIAFLNYHPEGKFNFNHLMFYKDNELVGVLPNGLQKDGSVIWSPTGASYGSIVTRDIAFELSLEIVDSLMEYCREQKIDEIFLIPPPIIYNKIYNQHIDYALLYRKFDFELHYISHAVHLYGSKDIFKKFDKKARHLIKKNKENPRFRVEISEDLEAFYPILLENKAKHGVKPTHTLEDLYKLKELLPDNLKLFLAYYDDKPIAGSLLFLANRRVALCFYQMLLYDYKYLHPVFSLMNETVKWSLENGYEWFDIGVSQDTTAENPMTPSLNLIYFKERFFARGLLRTTYHYDFRKEIASGESH